MSIEQLQAELEKVRAENNKLRQARVRELSFKVSEKGALSVYGLGRFPVTLYREQWTRLLGASGRIQEFIAQNDAQLKLKEIA